MNPKPPIRNILCAVDFSAFSETVAGYGTGLAACFNAKLFVFHAVSFPRNLLDGSTAAGFGDMRRHREAKAMRKIAALMASRTVDWEPIVAFDDPITGIHNAAADKNIDAILAASYGLKGIKRMLLGAVVENLARSVPRPLWVVPSRAAGSRAALPVRRIVAGTDLSADSRNAVSLACRIAKHMGARIDLVHAMVAPGGVEETAGFYGYRERRVMDRLRSDLAAWIDASGFSGKLAATPVVVPGTPGECLMDHAVKTRADLIVVGVRHRTRFSKLLIGSATEAVLRRAPCPVLAVPAQWEAGNE